MMRGFRGVGGLADVVDWTVDPTADYSGGDATIPYAPVTTTQPTSSLPSASGTNWGQIVQTVVQSGVQAYQTYTKAQAQQAGYGVQYSAQYPQGYIIQNGAIVPITATAGALSGNTMLLLAAAVAAILFLK